MKKPVPPSNFRTKDPDTQVDLRRLRDAWQDLLDWITANKSTVDLSAYDTITGNNSRYLLRAAADFATGISNKPSPVAADRILLEDSAASYAKKYATLSTLATAIGAASSGSWRSVHVPPTSANAEDEEFNGSSVPTGFGVIRSDTGAALTTTTGIDPFTGIASISSPVQWQMGYRTSCLSVQNAYANGSTNPGIWLYRPLVAPLTVANVGSGANTAPVVYRTRALFSNPFWNQVTQGNQGQFGFGLAADNGSGLPLTTTWVAVVFTVYPGNNSMTVYSKSRCPGVNSGNSQVLFSQTFNDPWRTWAQIQHFVLIFSKLRYQVVAFGDEHLHYLGGIGGTHANGLTGSVTFSHVFWSWQWDGAVTNDEVSAFFSVDYFRRQTTLP